MFIVVFWISAAFILYTYLLYPVGVMILARIARRKVKPQSTVEKPPTVTMIIVVYNEENRVEEKIGNCLELDYPRDSFTICFVSDGSTDRTNDMLRGRSDILFIEDPENRGKPYQLNRAAAVSESQIIVFSDVRQMYERDALHKLVRNFTDPAVGAVSGELTFRPARDHTEESIGIYWRYEKALRKAESDIDSTLGVTGAIYAIRRDLFARIPDDTILDDVEIPLRAFERGYRVTFEPEARAHDTASSEIGVEFRRKVRTLTGNFQLFRRNMWLLNPARNRIFVQAVSHKLFRLIVPYALLALLVTSLLGEGTTMRIFFWLQMLCYAVGTAGLAWEGIRRNRIANIITVFLALNAASVAALFKHLFSRTDARWKRTTRRA